MIKRKEGSALLVTVVIFMFVTIVSAALLSMITSNYYGRVSESKRAENLYGSESGLDTTYNIIAKTIEAANVYGKENVENLKTEVENMDYNGYKNLSDNDSDKKSLYALYADIEYWRNYNGNIKDGQATLTQESIDAKIKEDNDDIDKLINYVFKSSFKSFIQNNLETSVNNSEFKQFINRSDGTLVETTEQLDIGDAKVHMGKRSTSTDVDENSDSSNNSSNSNTITFNHQGNPIKVHENLKVESRYDDDGKIMYDTYPLDFSLYNEEDYPLTVTSEFQTNPKENTARVGKNLRVIEANYLIRVPNYNEVAVKESDTGTGSNINQLVGFTVGGDLNVIGANKQNDSSANKLNITGDIFVQGNEFAGTMNSSNRTFEKYSGGIILNDDAVTNKTIKFNNNVFTRGTFNIKNNVYVTINGDLYARNIYAGNENALSDNSKLTVVNEAVIDNDLAVKATNTAIKIKDFYGINDQNVDYDTKTRKSSSIIINDYKTNDSNKSSVTISDAAYIMGVAHINTQDGYPTGESVAVKGNYKAYSVPDSDGTEVKYDPVPYYDGTQVKYDTSLPVLDTDNTFEKIKHFYQYWKDPNNGSIDDGGVSLPTATYSIGDTVSNGKVGNASTYDPSIKAGIIRPKQLDYARKVYTIGQKNLSDTDAGNLYDSIGDNADNVSSLLNKIIDHNLKNTTNDGEKFAMFCKDKDKNIVIKGKNSTGNYTTDDIVIDAHDNEDVKAVIVTMGDVIVDGEVNFRGDIIANGNLQVLGDSTVNLYYDNNITHDIQNSEGSVFNTVFGSDFGGKELNNNSLDIQSNSSNFLKTKLWKIVQ